MASANLTLAGVINGRGAERGRFAQVRLLAARAAAPAAQDATPARRGLRRWWRGQRWVNNGGGGGGYGGTGAPDGVSCTDADLPCPGALARYAGAGGTAYGDLNALFQGGSGGGGGSDSGGAAAAAEVER